MKKSNKRPNPPRHRPGFKHVSTKAEIVAPPPIPANKRLVFKPEVLDRVGVTYVSLWRWMANGRFPNSRMVGGQIAWLESEIDEWMESRPKPVYRKREVA